MKKNLIFAFFLIQFGFFTICAQIYVSPEASNKGIGSLGNPFSTVDRAIQIAKPGDTIYLREGTYRETVNLKISGTKDRPIRIEAYQNEKPVFDGTDLLQAKWKPFKDGIYVADCDVEVEQLFDGKVMLGEARWPNASFDKRWDRHTWASSSKDSKKNTLISKNLKGSTIDWTGALATLNVGHQYKTWIREVTSFNPENGLIKYELNEKLGDGKDSGKTWEDDYFFLFGKLEALDAPGEWYYDKKKKKLYFMPIMETPEQHQLYVKKRTYGIYTSNTEHVVIDKIQFHACTILGKNVSNITLDNSHFRYPTYNRLSKNKSAFVSLLGSSNTIQNCSLAYSQLGGFMLNGKNNLIFNSVVWDVNWLGDISYAGIRIDGDTTGNTIQNCTVGDVGNIGIIYGGQNNVVIGNHVFSTGKMCKDIAAIHTGGAKVFGSICAYNWVHNSSGMGIRGDDQTRGLTVHHNVVWNTKEKGMIIKGDFNQVYNNTIFHINGVGSLIMPVREEPKKWWTKNEILNRQNKNSIFINNTADIIAWRNEKKTPNIFKNNMFLLDIKEHQLNNKVKPSKFVCDMLENPEKWNFLPKAGTKLIDSGISISGFVIETIGLHTDIGAYELGGEKWIPGADWKPNELIDDYPMSNTTFWEVGSKAQKSN